jgi:hypothetical protein
MLASKMLCDTLHWVNVKAFWPVTMTRCYSGDAEGRSSTKGGLQERLVYHYGLVNQFLANHMPGDFC